MLTVHHLNNSRSQRILWLLEELEQPYELVKYQRLQPVPLAPPELKYVHPLGKAPVIVDDAVTIAESGAIIEYIIDTYGKGRFKPARGSAEHWRYIEWLHFAEGSAMVPFTLRFYLGRLSEAAAPLRPRIDNEIETHLRYMSQRLGAAEFFVGEELTGADIQLLFVLEIAATAEVLVRYPNLSAYVERMHARPAYQRAIERGGPYQLMRR